jgi:hypothetical protein
MGRGGGTGGEVGLLQPPRGAARGPGLFLISRWVSGNVRDAKYYHFVCRVCFFGNSDGRFNNFTY